MSAHDDDDQPIQTSRPTGQPTEAAAGGSAGAPPSNTAPDTSNAAPPGGTRILAAGIDSLYLSYGGSLHAGTESLLSTLKSQAQSRDPELRSLAQYPVGRYLFEVSDKGFRRFAFVLADSMFRIELSKRSAESLPLAHVQISSAAIAAYGVKHCVRELTSILSQLGTVVGDPTVSRADLFVDAVTSHDLAGIEDEQWVTRARDIARYSDSGRRSGYAIGRGGDLSCRLYDKTREMRKSGRDHATRAWLRSGWNGTDIVWRVEIQFRRGVLRDLGIRTVPELLAACGAIWHYALEKWCRLCVVLKEDRTRSRWPTNPFWESVTNASDFHATASIGRRWLRMAGAPSDPRLADMFIGPVTSYMAKYGEMSFAWALYDLVDLCEVQYSLRAESSGIEPGQHVARKVAEKTRRFGTGPAYKVPPSIPLRLDRQPRQEGLDYDDEDET